MKLNYFNFCPHLKFPRKGDYAMMSFHQIDIILYIFDSKKAILIYHKKVSLNLVSCIIKSIFECPTLMPCICRLLLYGVQSSSSCSTVYFHSSLLSPLLMLHRCFCGFSRILPFRFWIDGSMLRRKSLRRRMLLTKLQPRAD